MNDVRGRPTRALVVDDHPIITDALSSALLSLRVFDGIDKESSLADASARLSEAGNYDLIILDLHLSADIKGLAALTSVRESYPELPVIIFSVDDSSATITSAFEHGVQGYISKKESMTVVINAIRIVLSGGNYIPPQVVRMLGFEPRGATNNVQVNEAPILPSLSPRQREVMHNVLQGLPNKVIARRLSMADGTVKSHLNTVYRMFGVNSRAQLILKARDMGLI